MQQRSALIPLSIMMFLQFFIWGAWLPLTFGYLPEIGFTPFQASWVMNGFTIASVTAMLFSTQFADRNFSAEKFVAFSHLVGGLAILGLAFTRDFSTFFILMLVHSLFYVPTISITNSIAFANLTDGSKQFGLVRLWGTIGWIAAGVPPLFFLGNLEGAALTTATSNIFIVAGIASLALAAFSLFLPHTPPKPKQAGESGFALGEALQLLKYGFILLLFIVTFIDAGVHQCYFLMMNDFLKSIECPPRFVTTVMSVGQVAEILTMLILGYVLKSLGWRYTMTIGVLGHAVRFGVFALLASGVFPASLSIPLAVVMNMMHGVCYAFFFATVYIFVDEYFPKDVRSTAQGLFNFLILGAGPFVANFLWPWLNAELATDGKPNFDKFFLYPAGTALVAAIALLLFFHPPKAPDPVLAEGKAAPTH